MFTKWVIMGLKFLLVFTLIIGCNLVDTAENKDLSIDDDVDSVLIIFSLQSNMDTIKDSVSIYHNSTLLYQLVEGIIEKLLVPEDNLVIEWSTKHISGISNWPYVYWLELDGSGWSDTTVVDTIYPVENNRYYIRGTEIVERY